MFTIEKEFHFSASHQLNSLPDGHPCKRLHGHNYVVVVGLSDLELDEHGFVMDYNLLKPLKDYIDNQLDHRHLNDVLPCQPSAENIAKWLFDLFAPQWESKLDFIRVKETPKTAATYYRSWDYEPSESVFEESALASP